MALLWGIDIGGTKLEGAVLDESNLYSPLCRLRLPTEADQGYEHILSQVAALVSQMSKAVGSSPSVIGFGTPGVLDPKLQTLKNSNTQCLNGKAFKKDLEQTLKVPALLCNDANCFALAETLMGAAKGASNVFGVIMGTGVGGGVVINRSVVHGLQGIAGEWGHNVLDPAGPDCYCGKSGCVEKIISGPATEAYYQSLSGEKCTLHEIEQRAQQDSDKHARATIDRLATWFGRAITVVINILDPDVIVLGGGVSNIAALYSDSVDEARRNVFNNRLETPIIKNQLGDSAGVFGAALLTLN